ncbi:MAG: HEAT repeat domain-containing protein [Kiritimatiellae bacterium]|nr:HEAT repeat domain-containing protein [Kiritimatiellia bacterium]MDD5520269.1 HEAT repeat domain-containing protein [Kiritimatiellia bacterium]
MNRKTGLSFALLTSLALSAFGQANPYAQLPAYDFGKDSTPVMTILQEVQSTKPSDYPPIETKLLAAMANPSATYACKKFVCETLRIVGSEACVEPVLKLMTDEKTADIARLALESNPAKSVDKGLVKASKSAPVNVQIGIMNTLAARRSDKLAGIVKGNLSSGNPDLVKGSLQALTRCGCTKALKTLKSARVAAEFQPLLEQALVNVAFNVAREGEAKQALAVFNEQYKKGTSLPAIIAAMNGLADYSPDALLIVTGALKDQREQLALAAAKATQRMKDAAVTKELCTVLPGLKPSVQVAVLRSLGIRADKSALPAIKTALTSSDEKVKVEAALALEKTGDSSVVGDLIAMAIGTGDSASAAQWTLGMLNTSGIDDVMIKMMEDQDVQKVRIAALTLKARGNFSIMPRLLKMVESDKAEIRNVSLEVLDGFARGEEMPALITLLQKAHQDSRGKIASAIWKATKGLCKDDDERFTKMWTSAAGSPDVALAALLPLATAAGGAAPLKIITDTLAAAKPDLIDPATRTLFNWPNNQAIPAILDLIKKTTDAKYRILGTRAIVRILNDRKCGWPAKKKIETLEQVLPIMERAEDKKMVEDEIKKFKEGPKK